MGLAIIGAIATTGCRCLDSKHTGFSKLVTIAWQIPGWPSEIQILNYLQKLAKHCEQLAPKSAILKIWIPDAIGWSSSFFLNRILAMVL